MGAMLCCLNVNRSQNPGFATSQKVQSAIQLLLDLVLHPSYEGTPVQFAPS